MCFQYPANQRGPFFAGKIKEALRLVSVRSFFINVLCPKFNERAPVSTKIIRFHVVIHSFIYSSAGGLHVIREV